MSERVKIIAAILLALACSAWMFMRWMPTSPAERAKVDERRSEIAGVGQKLLAELSSRSLTDFSTPEQFVNETVELFPPAEVGSSTPAQFDGKPPKTATFTQAERDTVARQTLVFFAARFMSREAAEYIRWRESAGYRWRDEVGMKGREQVAYTTELYTGAPVRPDESLESLFTRVWPLTRDPKDPNYRGAQPVAIITDPRMFRVEFSLSERSVAYFNPMGGEFAREVWDRESTHVLRRWFTWPVNPEQIVKANGTVRVARVGFVVEQANGVRCSMISSWFHDPAADRWWLWAVWMGNQPEGAGSLMEY